MLKKSLLAGAATLALMAPAAAQTTLYDLRTELLDNPIGIDAPKPRFSWKMKDDRPGAHQKAYQVQVATTTESLTSGKPDLWDSGRQETSASAGIEYAGPALQPRSFYVWRVKIWDATGAESSFSNPAHWETGLMAKENWKAQWISGDYKRNSADASFENVTWVWFPGGQPHLEADKGKKYFRYHFELPAKSIKSASGWSLVDNSATYFINGQRSTTVNGFKGIGPVDVTALKPGANVIQVEASNSGKNPAGLAFAADIEFADGTKQRIATDASWRVSAVPDKKWPGEGDKDGTGKPNWIAVQELGPIGMEPWGKPNVEIAGGPASLLRKEFAAAEKPSRARLYITALGSYRAEINGHRVGNDVLTPDWTDYTKRVMYQAYDVTDLVASGENALGITLGDGWYGSALGWALASFNFGPPPPRAMAELHLDYPSGKHDVVITDSSWKTAESAIQRSELYYGEIYDARKEQAGWSSAKFDDTKWAAAKQTETSSTIAITAQESAPIRITKQVVPIAITEPTPGTFVYDMGQNMVGWARLKVSGKAGDTVRMRFAEILNPDGTIYRDNLRRAEATDTYTLKGGGEEIFEPHFTYHGFRYVEVTGYPGGKPGKDVITGQVFHTDLAQSGKFQSSDPMVNKIVQNTQWGLWGNLMSVPTDCPQRDERLGWTGDAQAIWKTACYLMDMEAFTEKWCLDLRDAQSEQGDYPNVAPRVISTNEGAPAWADAGIIVPYETWRMYGDTRLLTEMWDSMETYMKYLLDSNPNYLWLQHRGNDYGDWVPADSKTDKDLIATAYWAGDARMMAQMATALGKADRAAHYTDLYGKIKKAFQDKFIQPDGKIANGSQTCYVLALEVGLVQPELVSKAVGHLLDDIKARNNHLSTGFLGSTHLNPVLTELGQNAMAITLLLNKTYPSWGYMVEKGATTIWERWNSDTGDPSMNSFNHYNYGAVTGWMYGYLAGVRPVASGFSEFQVQPNPDPRINSVAVTYESARGPIVSNWKYEKPEGGALTMHVEIPANTTAKIVLPTADAAKVKLGGQAVPADMKPTTENGRVALSATAGKYDFVIAE